MALSNQFKNWLSSQLYVAADKAYPEDMRLAGSLLFKNDLFTTTSINRLEAYQQLLNEKPVFQMLPKARKRNINSAFHAYIKFIKETKAAGEGEGVRSAA